MERKMSNQNLLTFANIVIFEILWEKFRIILARRAHMEIDAMRDAMIVIIFFNCTCIIGHVAFFHIFIFYNSENALYIDFKLYILLQVQMEAPSRKKTSTLETKHDFDSDYGSLIYAVTYEWAWWLETMCCILQSFVRLIALCKKQVNNNRRA